MEGSEGQGLATATPEATNAEAQAQGGQANPQAAEGNAVKDAAKEAIRKHKLKVDGQEMEVDEEELKRGYAHQKAANKRLQEGMKAKKMAEDFMSAMKNPETLLDTLFKLGHDKTQVRKLAESFLAGELEEDMLDPREKELRSLKAELEKEKAEKKRQQDERENKIKEEMKKKFSEDYSRQFVDALKESGIPPTKAMVSEMAKYIARSAKIGFEMTAKEAAKLVKEDIEMAHRNLYGEADAETLIKLIGEQGLQKVRTYDTSRLRDPNTHLSTPKEQGELKRERSSGKRNPMTPAEWRAFNRAK